MLVTSIFSDSACGRLMFNASVNTSSIVFIGLNVSSFFTSSGTSSKSFMLRFGSSIFLMPERCAAITFSFIPPTGSTRPVRDISPVMAIFESTGIPVISDARVVVIVIPADGPSFGIAPSGTCMWMSCLS